MATEQASLIQEAACDMESGRPIDEAKVSTTFSQKAWKKVGTRRVVA